MDGREILEGIVARLNAHRDRLEGLSSDYVVELTGAGGGSYRLRIQEGSVTLLGGDDEPAAPRASVALSAEDLADLVEGRTSAVTLFMQGRVHLQGDLSEAFRLESLLRE